MSSVMEYYPEDTKLDLPGTAQDFAAIDNAAGVPSTGLLPKAFQYRTSGSQVADATGAATINAGAPPPGWEWLIERIVVSGQGAPEVRVYVGAVQDNSLADFGPAQDINVADEASPIFVPTGQALIFVAASATVGTFVTVNYQVTARPVG